MKILENVSLKPYNTFGVDSASRYFAEIENSDDTAALVDWCQQKRLQQEDFRCLLVGGGSNLLFKHDFPGLVAHIAISGKEKIHSDDKANYIRAGAGENWHDFVLWTIEQGYAGLENLSLIPGTVGAAPVQNIGAYGVELVDVFHSLEAVDLHTGEVRQFNKDDCQFAYRDSYFKSVEPGRYLITSVTFRLPLTPSWKTTYAGVKDQLNGQQPSARLISDIVVGIRQSKLPDPSVIGNAGSFFKNPILSESDWSQLKGKYPELPGFPQKDQQQMIKTSAAWLIDHCGWKGRKMGDAGVYGQHALVLVNHGAASGAQIWELAETIMQSVEDNFGISLEPEPRVIG